MRRAVLALAIDLCCLPLLANPLLITNPRGPYTACYTPQQPSTSFNNPQQISATFNCSP